MTHNTEAPDFSHRLARQNLCRAIFDNLFEHNLLGALLSSKHFRLYLQDRFQVSECKDHATQTLCKDLPLQANTDKIHDIQIQMLKMFSAFFIEESQIESEEELMRDLDMKYYEVFKSLPGEFEPSHPEIIKIWNERRLCFSSKYFSKLQA